MEKRSRKTQIGAAAPITISLIIIIIIFANLFGDHNFFLPSQLATQGSAGELQDYDPITTSPLSALVRGKDRGKLESSGYACDIAENSIVCISNQAVRIDTRNNITTIYDPSIQQVQEQSIKPYALQKDAYLLQYITPVKVLHSSSINPQPVCEFTHKVPAVIFSTGISGNIFHEINDIIIPLFLTTKLFYSRVQIIIQDYEPAFVSKYDKVLSRLSRYQVINPAANKSVHCFPSMILGLKYHDNLALNPNEIPGGYTMRDFRRFLQETYHMRYKHVSQIQKPRLLLISRDKKRRFINQDDMVDMMRGLGFEVIVAGLKEAWYLNKFIGTVNSCSVLVGAHGAGLTNEIFLPNGAVMVQIEPLGLEWAAATYYGNPASTMGVHYLRYKIEPEESSLLELYGKHHKVITDPESVFSAKGYRAGRAVYLDQQDLKVNVPRLRGTLLQALNIVRNSSFT